VSCVARESTGRACTSLSGDGEAEEVVVVLRWRGCWPCYDRGRSSRCTRHRQILICPNLLEQQEHQRDRTFVVCVLRESRPQPAHVVRLERLLLGRTEGPPKGVVTAHLVQRLRTNTQKCSGSGDVRGWRLEPYGACLSDHAQVVRLQEGHDVKQHVVGHGQERTSAIAPALDHVGHVVVLALPRHLPETISDSETRERERERNEPPRRRRMCLTRACLRDWTGGEIPRRRGRVEPRGAGESRRARRAG
jgi:hypothetical protein